MPESFTNLTVVLVRTRNPLNIGAAARAMQNFGVAELRVVAPFETAFRKARSAVGAGAVLEAAREYADIADAVADCRLVVGTTAARRRELHQPLVPLQQAADPIATALSQGRVALLFGSEKHGLTRDALDRCHWLLNIPAQPEQPSFNLGQSVAVCLWELTRAASPVAETVAQHPAPAGDVERLASLSLDALRDAGYTQPDTEENTRSELLRMLLAYRVTEADAKLLMGMVRKLSRRVRS